MCCGNILALTLGIIVALKTIESRKYDVNSECLKIYGEDLKSVLNKFRRTPEYLKILNIRIATLKTQFNDMMLHISFHYHDKLKEKVADVLGIKQSDLTSTTATTRRLIDELAGAEAVTEPEARNFLYRRQWKIRAEETGENSTLSAKEKAEQEAKNRRERLDSYFKLYSTLTLAQRNALKNIGFEYAGRQIHSIIRSGGGNDADFERSTRLPDGGEKPDNSTQATTRHVLIHDVTATATTESVVTEGEGELSSTLQGEKETDLPIPPEVRYRYRPIHL